MDGPGYASMRTGGRIHGVKGIRTRFTSRCAGIEDYLRKAVGPTCRHSAGLSRGGVMDTDPESVGSVPHGYDQSIARIHQHSLSRDHDLFVGIGVQRITWGLRCAIEGYERKIHRFQTGRILTVGVVEDRAVGTGTTDAETVDVDGGGVTGLIV